MDVDEQQKKKRGPYNVPSTETVVVAAREVMAGKAELQVSKQYNIKVSTLRDRMRSYAENGTWEKKPVVNFNNIQGLTQRLGSE